jgi:hypothetical protein
MVRICDHAVVLDVVLEAILDLVPEVSAARVLPE